MPSKTKPRETSGREQIEDYLPFQLRSFQRSNHLIARSVTPQKWLHTRTWVQTFTEKAIDTKTQPT